MLSIFNRFQVISATLKRALIALLILAPLASSASAQVVVLEHFEERRDELIHLLSGAREARLLEAMPFYMANFLVERGECVAAVAVVETWGAEPEDFTPALCLKGEETAGYIQDDTADENTFRDNSIYGFQDWDRILDDTSDENMFRDNSIFGFQDWDDMFHPVPQLVLDGVQSGGEVLEGYCSDQPTNALCEVLGTE